jgi:hypothetical protein
MKTTTLVAGLLALLVAGAAAGLMPKYKVTTQIDKKTDFSRLKTYVWEPGWASYDADAHKQIVAVIDRELTALGFSKGTEGHADVTVVYATLRRTDVDLKTKARTAEGLRPTFPVATLVVLIREPGTHKELFRARADTPVDMEPEKLELTINHQVEQMFLRYPTKHAGHSSQK